MYWKSISVFMSVMLTAVSVQAAVSALEPSSYSCQDGALPIEESPIILAAAQILSGSALEEACRAHAEQALKNSQEWERLGCAAKLHMTSQVFSLDLNSHVNRCKVTLGTAIRDDQEGREALLARCRGVASPPSSSTTPPPSALSPPQSISPPPPSQPGQEGNRLSGVWEISLLDLKTLKGYRYTYTLTFAGNQFEGRYLNPGDNPSKFQGFISGDGYRIQYTQIDGNHRGNYAGKTAGRVFNRYEGAACDSQGNIFLFTLNKK